MLETGGTKGKPFGLGGWYDSVARQRPHRRAINESEDGSNASEGRPGTVRRRILRRSMPPHEELRLRMSKPQRHRLLQGYPMLPLMREAVAAEQPRGVVRRIDGTLCSTSPEGSVPQALEEPWMHLDPTRPLLVGVLPHTQCNPRVEGCGFCTFAHDRYASLALESMASFVNQQITDVRAEYPDVARRRVTAVYVGGATANLAPYDVLRDTFATLTSTFDLADAEITLEGVPARFRTFGRGPFEALLEAPARHRRISMGVQTFDTDWLRYMGRTHFGSRRTVARVVEKAHAHRFTASVDLLVNLPREPLSQMLADVRDAVSLGADQICIYHLVLTADLGTPWARDPGMLAGLPSSADACGNWLAVREALLSGGYVQTTLTNFERSEVAQSDRRFLYEVCSFTPDVYDAIGFGPLGISTFINMSELRAVKLVRGKRLDPIGRDPRFGFDFYGSAGDLFFPYEGEDVRLLYLTRSLARLRIDGDRYRGLFGTEMVEDFAGVLDPLGEEKLVELVDGNLALTPRGMFYADSVAGLLASERVRTLRSQGAAGLGMKTSDWLIMPTADGFMG
jgi:hypothetical protein